MKTLLLVSVLYSSLATLHSSAQEMYFPPQTDTTWQTVSLNELGWCAENLDTLYRYLDRNGTRAFIVLKDGRIAIEWYATGFFKEDNWYWASAAKTVTSTLIGIAQQEGKLLISDTSSTYLGKGWSDLTAEQESQITVRHHLTMTTGLDDGVADPYCTDKTCLVFKAAPGTRWAYHNAPYTLLDKVIEGSTGEALNQYYDKKLKRTIGMDGLFIKDGFNNLLVSTPRAMARFGLMALNNFSWNGTKILTDATYAHDAITRSQELNQSYGYLWWLNGQPSFMLPGLQFVFQGPIATNQPPDAFNGLGKNDQIVTAIPSKGLVVVRMGDAATPDGPQVPTIFLNEMWGLLRNVMCESTGIENSEQRVANSNSRMVNCGVYDVMGRIVGNDVKNTAHLTPGLYFILSGTDHQLLTIDH